MFGPAITVRTRDEIFKQVREPRDWMPPDSPEELSDADLEKIAACIEAPPAEPAEPSVAAINEVTFVATDYRFEGPDGERSSQLWIQA